MSHLITIILTAQSINLLKTIKVTLVKVLDIQVNTKNWPATKSVKVRRCYTIK
jgi:hypothetical protein